MEKFPAAVQRDTETQSRLQFFFRMLLCLALLCWTGAFSFSLWYYLNALEQYAVNSAQVQARTAFEKDVLYRRWNAMHGGVMAPVVPGALEPNPHLSPQGRDITGTDGISYTKINPAYMTRLVHELGSLESGILGHITGNRPLRENNAPDTWESAALRQLETGSAREISSLENINGASYLRFIRPLLAETSCLPCHQAQGYTLGQVIGGISISVPMTPITNSLQESQQRQIFAHGCLWALGMIGIAGAAYRLARGMKERERIEELLRAEVAQRHEAEKMLRVAAGTDTLTGLPNRRTALERLNMEIARYKRSKVIFSMLLLDVDFFKNINDTWGHEVGDKALLSIADRLHGMLRGQDIVARWGGEEFLVILTETRLEGAFVAAQKICAEIAEFPLIIDRACISLTVSIGVAEYQPDQSIAFSIKCADDAMYTAKRLGRNRVEQMQIPTAAC